MQQSDRPRSAAHALVDQLIVNRVRHVFCVPGESYLAVLDAIRDRDVTITVCRNEAGAAMMAEAMGKATGRPGVCFVTRGPGATNASPGVHIARHDSTPMVLFIGQIERAFRDRDAFQEMDYRAFFGSLAKWTTEIDEARRVPEIVSRAFQCAMEGRPGPVVVSLPRDMLDERVLAPKGRASEPVETFPGAPAMAAFESLLAAAERPFLILGGARWSEAAARSVLRFAERFELPVATSYRRGPLFDALHPCYAGDLGIGPNPKLIARIKNSDLPILLGGQLGEIPSQGFTLFKIPDPRVDLIHIHPSAEELGAFTRPGSPFTPRRSALRPRSTRLRRARPTAGARKREKRTRNSSPGRRPRRRSPARSIWVRSWSGCATMRRLTRSCAMARAITPRGFIASTDSAGLTAISRRLPPQWVMACRPPWRCSASTPNGWCCRSTATAIS